MATRSIDIHAHFYPQEYLDLVASEGAEFGVTCDMNTKGGPTLSIRDTPMLPTESKFISIEDRIAAMDAAEVDVHALSLTTPMAYWAGPELSARLCQAFNDACSAAHKAHPDRLYGLATLPMQEPSLAVDEVKRAAALPGIKGIYLATRIIDRELGDPAFTPVFEAITEHKLPVFLHPVYVVDPQRLAPYYLNNLIGNPTESAIAASHLIFGGVLDRFPDLTICLPHGGGSFPYLVGRIHHGWKVRPECKHLEHGPVTYLRRFYYDTVTHSHPALSYLIGLVGADRVVLGSDFCFDMGYEDPVQVVMCHPALCAEDQDKILGGNAATLLGI